MERFCKIAMGILIPLLVCAPLPAQYTVGSRSFLHASAAAAQYVTGSYAFASNGPPATLATSCAGGELMAIFVLDNYSAVTAFTVTVSTGTAQTIQTGSSFFSSPNSLHAQSFYIANCAAGSFTLQAAANSYGTPGIAIARYTGLSTEDGSGTWAETVQSTGTTVTVPCSIATTATDTVIANVFGENGGYFDISATWTISSGYTARSALTGYVQPFADQIGVAAGTQSFTASATGTNQTPPSDYECGMMAFH